MACGTCGVWRGAYRVLVGKREGKRPLGEPRLGQCWNGPSRNRIVVGWLCKQD